MEPELVAFLFVLAMFSGVFIVYQGLRQRSRQLEMQHQERMALIEKGQIPLAEPTVRHYGGGSRPRSSRALSGGIIVVGLGLALMTIIGIAGESPEIGLGVGGAIAVLGGAFIVLSVVARSEPSHEDSHGRPPIDE